jgi:hypothetical protein
VFVPPDPLLIPVPHEDALDKCGDPPAYTSKQIGHADVRFTLNVYTHAAEHREQLSETAREQYDKALQWAGMGSNDPEAAELAPKLATENPA